MRKNNTTNKIPNQTDAGWHVTNRLEAEREREGEGGRERESCVIYSVIEPPRGLNLFSVSGFLNSQFLNNVQTSTYSHAYYLSNGLFYL